MRAPTYGQEKQDGRNSPLKLTVTLLAQRYCIDRKTWDSPVGGSIVGTVSFDFRVRIQNVGECAIIRCKKCVAADWPNLFDMQADGTRGALRSEHKMEDCCGLIAPAHHLKRPDSDDPILSRAAELKMARSAGVGFGVFSEDHAANRVWVYPGRYFPQPRFLTWEQTDPGSKDLARRWKSYGDLDDEEIVAEPIPVEIEIQHDVPDCRTR